MKVTNQDVANRLRRHSNFMNLSINDVEFAYDQLRDEAGNPQRMRGLGFVRGVGEKRAEQILDLLESMIDRQEN